jgi:hypothetical protein
MGSILVEIDDDGGFMLPPGTAKEFPSILVLRKIMGLKKTVVLTSLVVVLSTIVGFYFR